MKTYHELEEIRKHKIDFAIASFISVRVTGSGNGIEGIRYTNKKKVEFDPETWDCVKEFIGKWITIANDEGSMIQLYNTLKAEESNGKAEESNG